MTSEEQWTEEKVAEIYEDTMPLINHLIESDPEFEQLWNDLRKAMREDNDAAVKELFPLVVLHAMLGTTKA